MPAIKPTRTVVGEALRSIREEKSRSLRSLAARTGYSHSYLAKIERGDHLASDDVVDAIAGALKCSPDEFTYRSALIPTQRQPCNS
jgi:transcriptional regulator with XRE-family HTH domain